MKLTIVASYLLTGGILTAQTSNNLKVQEPQSPPKEKTLGVGLMLGEPTGANLKYWLSEVSAIDGVVGISLNDHNDFNAHVDYLYHFNDLIRLDRNRVAVYFGGGPRFEARTNRDDIFGVRAVAGLDYIFDDVPVDVFLEAGPVFDVSPDFEVNYTVGIGARFWF